MLKNVRNAWLSCFSCLVLVSCVKPNETKVPTYEEARATASREGPLIDPPVEERYKLKCTDKPTVAKEPVGSLIFSYDRAECLRAQVAERDRLRTDLEAERLRARTKDIISTAALQRAAELNRSSWWDRHGGGILFATGAAVGMAIAMGVLYALTGGNSVTVNPHIIVK